VKGSEKLFQIYEYFPALYDAKIRNIKINLKQKEFYLTVDFSDLIGKSDESSETGFTICWQNVQKADSNWYSEDLDGMEFSTIGDFTKQHLKILRSILRAN
jgi:hypothetical protein